MSQEDVELVIGIFTREGAPEVEMGELMRDDEHWQSNGDRFSPNVEVRFVTPGDSGVEVMEQEFRGVDGLRQGWGVWMEPWEQFRVSVEEVVDTSDRQVLVLASAVARMRGTGAELPQEVAQLCRIEDGRITEVGFYLDQRQARRDAGLAG
jgi:ketosteroid isomerase-like protein